MNLLAVPGVVGVDVMPATLGSALERVDGLAGAVLDTSPARAGDLLFDHLALRAQRAARGDGA